MHQGIESSLPRRRARAVMVGGVQIGGDAPVSVQSMTNTDTCDLPATLEQVRWLAAAGADLVRIAVPSAEALDAFAEVKAQSPVPVIADVHFDHRLAIGALERGADKVRVNPGNIGGSEKLKAVAEAAADCGAALRVGVNAGSLERDLLERAGGPSARALVDSALRSLAMLDEMGFRNLVASIKSAHVPTMIEANTLLAGQTDVPLHLGVTEAGLPGKGTVKSAVGIGALLAQGIGDTIRVSLTGDPVHEVAAGRDILRSLGLLAGPDLVSCPTCARAHMDLEPLARRVEAMLESVEAPITVAVMGCEVNGPGEARWADVGIAAGRNSAVLFKHGEIVRRVRDDEVEEVLLGEIRELAAQAG
ncbi:MAG: flavodoxin-dependent (E)-4-hydroxy-3-methylbut-2-enyl-diphosphate synthase [Armatimonadota bacterium]